MRWKEKEHNQSKREKGRERERKKATSRAMEIIKQVQRTSMAKHDYVEAQVKYLSAHKTFNEELPTEG